MSEQKRKPADVDPVSVARSSYRAYVDKDRAAIEALIADDFRFTDPFETASTGRDLFCAVLAKQRDSRGV